MELEKEQQNFMPGHLPPLPALLPPLAVALASISIAFVVWESTRLGSEAQDATRRGLIDAVKGQAAEIEHWRQAYQEAVYVLEFVTSAAEVEELRKSEQEALRHQGEQLAQHLLPSLAATSPLAQDPKYWRPDGTLDVEIRVQELRAESPDLSALDPRAAFREAGLLLSQQRWLMADAVVMTAALFWFTLTEISSGRRQWLLLGLGALSYLAGVAGFLLVKVLHGGLRGWL